MYTHKHMYIYINSATRLPVRRRCYRDRRNGYLRVYAHMYVCMYVCIYIYIITIITINTINMNIIISSSTSLVGT